MRTMRVFAALVAVSLAVPASAQILSPLHVIPVVVHGGGVAPSFWKSDVFVFNYGTRDLRVGFAFFQENKANTLPITFPESQTRFLQAGKSLLIEDIVLTMFGLSSAKGWLMVTTDTTWFPANSPDPEKILVSARVYNTGGSSGGTFGQTEGSALPYLNASTGPTWSTGIRLDGTFRCNLGIGAFAPVGIRVHYRFRRADGSVAAEGFKDIKANSLGQWGIDSLGVTRGSGPLSVELWLDPGAVTPNPCGDPLRANWFFAYLSPVDGAAAGQGTGDGEMVMAVPESELQIFKCN